MKANSPSPATEDRPAPTRRRASRSFAPTSVPLEGRELLSTSYFASLPVAAPAFIGPVSATVTLSSLPTSVSAVPPGTVVLAGGEIGKDPGPGPAPPSPTGSQPPIGQSPPHDRLKDRVGLAET